MTAMLMPQVNSYFAIYTLMAPTLSGHMRSSANWDLHATATDRALAIAHAKMLALQPGVDEVHVKQVEEHVKAGLVSVRNIRCMKRGHSLLTVRLAMYASAIIGAITFIAIVF